MSTMRAQWPEHDLERARTCPVCRGSAFAPVYDGLVDLEEGVDGAWSMVGCRGCGSLLLDPRPTPAALPRAYGTYYTHDVPADENAPLRSRSLAARAVQAYLQSRYGMRVHRPSRVMGQCLRAAWPLRQQLDYYMRHLPARPGRLLDVGCGSGGFMARARQAGWEVVGVEPDPVAAKVARDFSGAQVHGSVEAVDGQDFDAITMAHVIEHLHDPAAMLRRCWHLLRPGGALWLATPNIHSIGHRVFACSWQPLETPRHLVMPSATGLRAMLGEVGFSSVRFMRRGRGARKRLLASAARARQERRAVPAVAPLSMLVDLAASLSPHLAEELVVLAVKDAR